MEKIISIGLIILAFFYPWASYVLIALVVLYLTYIFYGSTSKTKKTIDIYQFKIIDYFQDKIGNGEFHFNYVRKYSLYFLFPASSKVFAKILITSYISLIIISIIHFFRFDNSLPFIASNVAIIILAIHVSQLFEKPILDYQNKEKNHIKKTLIYTGIDEYPNFFYHGPWNKIRVG